jgi:hypothetical protein
LTRTASVLAALAVALPVAAVCAEPTSDGPAVGAVAAQAGPARPTESGAHDSAATVGPLAIGAAVKDPSGLEIGHIVLLTTGGDGRSVAKVRDNEDVFDIPIDELFVRRGVTFSRLPRASLERGGGAIAAKPAR